MWRCKHTSHMVEALESPAESLRVNDDQRCTQSALLRLYTGSIMLSSVADMLACMAARS